MTGQKRQDTSSLVKKSQVTSGQVKSRQATPSWTITLRSGTEVDASVVISANARVIAAAAAEGLAPLWDVALGCHDDD